MMTIDASARAERSGPQTACMTAATTTREEAAEPRGEELLAVGAALVTVVLWASAFVGIRAAGEDFAPAALALGRLLIGSVILGGFVLARREPLPRAHDLPLIAVCGLLWFAFYNVALNAGERRVDAGAAAMLVNIAPVLIAVLAGTALGEGFPRQLLIGCAVAFGGVAVIGLATNGSGGSSGWGALLCLVAAGAYSVALIVQKGVLRRVSALQTTFLCCLTATIALLPFAPKLADDVAAAPGPSIVWMGYLGAFPTAVAFTTWAYALARTDAGRLGATTYLVPPISVLLGWALLSETPPLAALAGGVLCLIGVALSRRR
jgi:drug/metabolite transporter (DMT)-like permease